jgi:hypothetical protein
VPSGSSFSDSARQQAHHILSHPPFTNPPSSTPHPLAGVVHAVGRGLEVAFGPALRWIGRHIFRSVGSGFERLFGGWAPVVGGALAVAAGVLVALLLVRRRSRIAARAGARSTGTFTATVVDPAELEAEADRLAAAGDYAASVRLRFEAGLLRLESAGLIAQQRTSTDAELTARIGSPSFSRLASRHEAIAYAGLPASAGDVQQARADWPQVPGEARQHRALSSAGTR